MCDAVQTLRSALPALAIAVGLTLGISLPAVGDEIPLNKVPAKVRKAADQAVPKAKWTEASRETEDGEVWYELEGTDARGRYVFIEVYDDGSLGEIQTEVTAKDVPQAVRAALKAKMPAFKPSTIYEVREEGAVTRYDFEGKRPRDKEEIGVSVSADGKTIEIDE